MRRAGATLTLLAALAGCGRAGDAPPASRPPRVALVMKSLANEFFLTMELSKGILCQQVVQAVAGTYFFVVEQGVTQ